jgi:hypothetical protein
MLFLEGTDHVSIVNPHALNKVLIVSLRASLTLHAVIYLLLQSGIIPGKHLNAVLAALIL